ncbi:hypothetical protein BH23ACT12_BH23ACT12_02650 [soil metagenome]
MSLFSPDPCHLCDRGPYWLAAAGWAGPFRHRCANTLTAGLASPHEVAEGFQALIQSLLPQTRGIFSVLHSNRSKAAENSAVCLARQSLGSTLGLRQRLPYTKAGNGGDLKRPGPRFLARYLSDVWETKKGRGCDAAHPMGAAQRSRMPLPGAAGDAASTAPPALGALPMPGAQRVSAGLYRLEHPGDAAAHLGRWPPWTCRCRIPAFVKLGQTIRPTASASWPQSN